MIPAPCTPLAIAPHVHCCSVDGQTIFLDLRQDRYFGIATSALRRAPVDIEGLSLPRAEDGADAAEYSGDVLSELYKAGVLQQGGVAAARDERPFVAAPTEALIDGYDDDRPPSAGPIAIARFFRAVLFTKALLRFRALEDITRRAQHRRARADASRRPAPSREHVKDHVRTYFRLRPLLLTPREACLFDSICLGELLWQQGIAPRWIFGVCVKPFAAHCWLQEDAVVFSDTPENVRRYTPILVI